MVTTGNIHPHITLRRLHEPKLMVMISQMKREIAAEKERNNGKLGNK